MNFMERMRAEARLVMLMEINKQPDDRLNSNLLVASLETCGITQSRDWVHEELRWMADVGAVTVNSVGTVRIASITDKGLDHLERRIVLEGIKQPSRAEA